jgi:hypothetical protein
MHQMPCWSQFPISCAPPTHVPEEEPITMFRKRLIKFLFALCGAVLLTTTSAAAHTGHSVTYTVSNSNTNAYPDTTSSITFGAHEANTITIDLEAGMKLAHDDQFGSEVTPNPNDEEEIGTGSALANWQFFGFCSQSTQNLTITWEETMTGAPSGAVAHYVMTNALGFDTDIWAIEQNDANDDYKLTMDLDESRTCSTQPTTASATINTTGTTASGGHSSQNPSSAGCYTVTTTFTDTSGTNHSGEATVSIGGASC